jgi:hypothetical protein
VIARIAVVLFALAVAGWLALGFVQARAERQAEEVALPLRQLSPGELARARDLLDRAGTLNPDPQRDITRGILLIDQNRHAAAARAFLEVTRREPENIEAWSWVQNAARDRDPRLARLVEERMRELRPPLGR